MRIARGSRWAAGPLLAALVLAGCGGSSSSASSTTSPTTPASTAPGSSTSSATRSSTSTTGGGALTTTVPRPAGVAPGRPLSASLRLSSPAFSPGAPIPASYTCDGQDLSLPLQWTGVPAGTRELVLVMRDPDAATPDFVHWALAGLAPAAGGFPAGGVGGHVIPGRNSFGALGYQGPCPPHGARAHHYVLTLLAIGAPSGLAAGFSADQLHTAALAIATLVGTYARR